MNTAKKNSGGGPLDPPLNTTVLDPNIHINTEKINIKTFKQLNTLYYMQVVCKTLCKTWKARSCPLYLTLALPPPFFFFFFFIKNLLRLKINILSSIYPEINFPAEPMMKINNLSRPKVPGPPLRIKWSSPYDILFLGQLSKALFVALSKKFWRGGWLGD